MPNYLSKYLKYKKKYVILKGGVSGIDGKNNDSRINRNCSLEVRIINGNIIISYDKVNNFTPKDIIERIRNDTEYKLAFKLITKIGNVIGINQTMNERIIDILSPSDKEEYSDKIVLTLVITKQLSDITDFDLIFNLSLNKFSKHISNINLERNYFIEEESDFEGVKFNNIFQNIIGNISSGEDRTGEITNLSNNLKNYLIEEETMNNILAPLLVELALSTTESIWVEVIIKLREKLSLERSDTGGDVIKRDEKFRKSIVNTVQRKFECTKVFKNCPRKMLVLGTLLARLYVNKFIGNRTIVAITQFIIQKININTYSILLPCLILIEKITKSKLKSYNDGFDHGNLVDLINDFLRRYKLTDPDFNNIYEIYFQ